MRDGLRAIHDAGPGEDEQAADAACGQPTGRGGDGKYDLSADDREWVERIAASLGPLTDKQRDILGCGGPVAGRADAVYCGPACRVRAHRARSQASPG
jgi:hypothetical protein